jgi:hypothetical protein
MTTWSLIPRGAVPFERIFARALPAQMTGLARGGSDPPEAYVGVMGTIGLDIGITAGGVLAWGVLAPTAGPMRGKLAGTYVGASGAVGVGVGVGANLLFGGSNRSIALQPLSVEGSVGINLSLGVSSLTLALAQ